MCQDEVGNEFNCFVSTTVAAVDDVVVVVAVAAAVRVSRSPFHARGEKMSMSFEINSATNLFAATTTSTTATTAAAATTTAAATAHFFAEKETKLTL